MRNEIKHKPKAIEVAVLNNSPSFECWQNKCKALRGTHWTCFIKVYNTILYYDPIGNLQPFKSFVKTYGSNAKNKIFYNYTRHQNPLDYTCGHHCVKFIRQFYKENKSNGTIEINWKKLNSHFKLLPAH